MDKKQIFIYALLFIVVAIRLYTKYVKKSGNKTDDSKNPGDSGAKEDDYEPYSKK